MRVVNDLYVSFSTLKLVLMDGGVVSINWKHPKHGKTFMMCLLRKD